jgi:hypothetical protein
MKAPISKETAEARVVKKFDKLYAPLIELVDALQNLEPGGTLVDDVVLDRNKPGNVHIEYVAKPISLTIKDGNKKLVLRVVELSE